MPTWGQITYELNKLVQEEARHRPDPLTRDLSAPSPHDVVRRKYVRELAEYTGRPVIVYASSWMEARPLLDQTAISVTNRDIMGFMETVHGLPRGPLDLILHSPGGDQNGAEGIMKYLRDEGFGPIRAIVPISAMSAATMMALCCDEILMGHHSQLGPIDPQFTLMTPEGPRSAPAQAILDQFEQAKTECAGNAQAVAGWLPILRSYAPGLLSQCVTAQSAAEDMVSKAMQTYMFADLAEPERTNKAAEIAAWFNDHKTHRSHGRPLRYEDVSAKGVKVSLLEDDNDQLQDKVLSAWHGVQLSLTGVAVLKLIENNQDKAWLLSAQPNLVLTPTPAPPQGGGQIPRSLPLLQPGGNRAARRQGKRNQ